MTTMPYKDIEIRKIYMKDWESLNRENRAWQFALWCNNNRERKRELNRVSYHRCKKRNLLKVSPQ